MPEYWLHPDEAGLPVRVTGAMLKKGGSRGGRRNWSKRWFVLEPSSGRLRYFEDPSLLKESGIVCLLGSTEVRTERPSLKGRHAPQYDGEDALYMELSGAVDGAGRPRPCNFAMRAFTQDEYDEWLRSIRFSIRKCECRDQKEFCCDAGTKEENLKLVVFDTSSLGMSLALSRGISTGATSIVVSKTKSDGPAATIHNLAEGDQLIAVHPQGDSDGWHSDDPLVGAQPLPKNLTVPDFEAVLATLRAAPRPLAVVFKTGGQKLAQITPPPSVSSDAETTLSEDTDEFYVLVEGQHQDDEKIDPIDFDTLQDRWRSGELDKATARLFVADAWVPFSNYPALIDRLETNKTTI